MDNIRIENNNISVEIKKQGAELCSIFDKKKNREVLWQADASFWGRHSPILFPNVGKQFNNEYRYNGEVYKTKQHGFARDSKFDCIENSNNKAVFELVSNDETRKIYPFEFILRITYTIKDNDLIVSWNVINTGDNEMFFTIGAHPAFNVPADKSGFNRSDYSVVFKGKDNLKYILLDPEKGTAVYNDVKTLKLNDNKINISDDLFDNDAYIFDNNQIESAIIIDKNNEMYVGMECKDFPNFGLWSAGKAPFICLEPWVGRCDDNDFVDEISNKNGINSLKKREEFNKEYKITIY